MNNLERNGRIGRAKEEERSAKEKCDHKNIYRF